ncbi:MAG: translation initiation factor IF-3 [Deltaproteobacteria bacterium]|nr:MAG: translation initiation factor IF-3 [Deltaproteobacteria bacterium]
MSKRAEVRVNEQIRAPRVRLIASDGTQIGIVTIKEALIGAQEESLDLVEVAPNADPPVCRIMDYGKLRYQSAKKTKGKTKSQHLKEVKLRPLTAEHDVGVKVRNIRRFLTNGDKVKVSMIFRGRERFHTELGLNLLNEVIKQIEDIGTVESAPKMQGRDLSMFVVPKSGG